MAEKLYYSMGEVTEMFDVNPSLIRYWGAQFDALAPKRNKKGNRMFTPEDIETLKLIYHLVKERGMTIDGARKALKARRKDTAMPREVELLERLQRLRSMLLQVREELGSDAGVKMLDSDIAPEEELRPTESAETVESVEEKPVEEKTVEEKPAGTKGRRGRKAKEPLPAAEPEQCEMFPVTQPDPQPEAQPNEAVEAEPAPENEERPLPFYEQTLF